MPSWPHRAFGLRHLHGRMGREVTPMNPEFRQLLPGQICRVHIGYADGHPPEVLFETDELVIEAPNWILDGERLIVNGDGHLWSLALDEPALTHIPLEGVPALNNDHVLAPDGERIFLSAYDGHIYEAPIDGGPARRITPDREPRRLHFLHGVSPDGEALAYIGIEPDGPDGWPGADVFILSLRDGTDTRLTHGPGPADGSEYAPRSPFIYLNTEAFSDTPGHAQIARMSTSGGELEQLTHDDAVNWFPHLAPDERHAVYLSFPAGTIGHPENADIELKLVTGDDWAHPRTIDRFLGGQGTINVNSWAPDSARFAYISYPVVGRG